MPAAATVGSAPATAPASGGGGSIPFFFGSNLYVQKFATNTWQLQATTQEFTLPVVAGGFLRGVRLQLRSAGGVGGTTTPDNPWNVFQSITLENVNGAALMFPMGGYAYYLADWFTRPWWGDPARRYDYATGPNPSGSLRIFPEIANTAGVLANTDARSQYRLRYTINTASNVIGTPTTARRPPSPRTPRSGLSLTPRTCTATPSRPCRTGSTSRRSAVTRCSRSTPRARGTSSSSRTWATRSAP
jgi:hypothetical protein